MTLTNRPLMVTENGHLPIGAIIRKHLLCHARAHGFLELFLERVRRVERTKHLGREAWHQRLQVLIQKLGLTWGDMMCHEVAHSFTWTRYHHNHHLQTTGQTADHHPSLARA